MQNMIIVSPLPLVHVSAGGAPNFDVSNGSGVANLAKPSPRSVWQQTAPGFTNISIDLGVDTEWDTVALIGTNASPDAGFGVSGGTHAQGAYDAVVYQPFATNLRAPSAVADPRLQPAVWPGLFHSPEPITGRYIRVSVSQGGAVPLYIGCLVVGKAFTPTWNREWDSGRGLIDTGSRTRLPDGGLAAVDGVAVPTFEWVFGDLTDAELATLWALVRDRRTTRPALVVEDPEVSAGLAERIHYGTFVNIEKYGRRQVGRTRWAFQFEDWL